ADEPRVPRPVVPHAPPRAGRLAGGALRAHLRAGFRPRLQHGRGLHRPAAAQAPALFHRDDPRARLPRGGTGLSLLRSFRLRLLLGSALAALGLLAITHFLSVVVFRVYRVQLRLGNVAILLIVSFALVLIGLLQIRRGLSPFDELRRRLASV